MTKKHKMKKRPQIKKPFMSCRLKKTNITGPAKNNVKLRDLKDMLE